MCDGQNTLYINTVVGEEEEEAKDDETRPVISPCTKNALGRLLYKLRNKD